MNPLQLKIEQTFKEYMAFKDYLETDLKDEEKLRKEVADEALKLETIEEQSALFFEKIGEKDILKLDFLETKKKLYYFVELTKDSLEIPEEITKELEGFQITPVFAIIGGKKETVNKEIYEKYKQQHLQYCTQFSDQLFGEN